LVVVVAVVITAATQQQVAQVLFTLVELQAQAAVEAVQDI
jgi:hypothetical protein